MTLSSRIEELRDEAIAMNAEAHDSPDQLIYRINGGPWFCIMDIAIKYPGKSLSEALAIMNQ